MDFSAPKYEKDDCCPVYMDSPYGSWLAKKEVANDPVKRRTDRFSVWFQPDSSSNRNTKVEHKDGIVLVNEGEKDSEDRYIYAFWNAYYWAVNGEGFKAEGQKHCDEDILVNMGLVSIFQ